MKKIFRRQAASDNCQNLTYGPNINQYINPAFNIRNWLRCFPIMKVATWGTTMVWHKQSKALTKEFETRANFLDVFKM